MKVLGIGLNKTGLTSLTKALKYFGFNVRKYPYNMALLRMIDQDLNQTNAFLDRVDGISDMQACILYKKIDKLYPNSKFILTTREKESWLESSYYQFVQFNPNSKLFWRLTKKLYGVMRYDREVWNNFYDEYVADVKEYFKDRLDDLLILDVEKSSSEKWELLSKFLNKEPNERILFPRVNMTIKKIKTRKRS